MKVYRLFFAANNNVFASGAQINMSLLSTNDTKSRWQQQVGAAEKTWGKFTEDELIKLDGHEQKLVGLIQERYAVTHENAEQQVKSFLDKHKSCSCCK